jgi:hypothetical protein
MCTGDTNKWAAVLVVWQDAHIVKERALERHEALLFWSKRQLKQHSGRPRS